MGYIEEINSLKNTITKLNRQICAAKEIFISQTVLTGVVPNCYKLGINTSTGILYFKNLSGNWQQSI